ncbi:MAG: lactoylglutathione lyase [Flavobacteriales bacterium]|nr:lactoylglutathione lyase [Flavobacteriales bacterium]MCB9335976.1 lactoylglutathione lyase [Flavobacteriales bacterium]
MLIEFILYVKDQSKSRDFYKKLLDQKPCLDVSGMTEFNLAENVKLGLMPEDGIAKIITPTLVHPSKANQVPRCELYLKVDNAEQLSQKAIELGGKLISPFTQRNWGDKVVYVTDLDNHVIAFAQNV